MLDERYLGRIRKKGYKRMLRTWRELEEIASGVLQNLMRIMKAMQNCTVGLPKSLIGISNIPPLDFSPSL